MSKLNIDQKTIKGLFSDKKSDFLIPDYQRPYAWGENECQTLWDDIYSFAIPDNDHNKFKQDDEYYFGPIVTFKNDCGKLEIIDGQQRLTTLMLLLRAFYERAKLMQDKESVTMRKMIEQCIWKTDEFGEPDKNALKINSEVATDEDKGEFLEILKQGTTTAKFKSRYADNYRFFENNINGFLNKFPSFFAYLPIRILNNCILLPIEAENQDTALRIFSTLNDRGKPLSDADIFKAEFYKYYSKKGEKDLFIEKWKELEQTSIQTFKTNDSSSSLDELFTRYMYYLRAKQKNTNSTTDALRKFYEKEYYKELKNESTLANLKSLLYFWYDVNTQNKERFSDRVLKRLFVLNYAPNGMWYYIVSVYFMHHQKNGALDDSQFFNFLEKITAFIWAYALTNPGVNALRTPVYREMVNIISDKEVTFEDFKFDKNNFVSIFKNFNFLNQRQITRSMITWWAFHFERQELLPIDCRLDIEHIYARNRMKTEPLSSDQNIDQH